MKILNPSKIKWLFPWILWHGNHKSSKLYLTFDDGPHPEYTLEILDILNHYQVKATFFVEGQKIKQNELILKKLLESKHVIGNHGFSHSPLTRITSSGIEKEIQNTHEFIKETTGFTPSLFRPPYGLFTLKTKSILQKLNYTMVLWDLMSYDFMENDILKLQNRMIKNLKPGCIIVNHDGHQNAPVLIQALPAVLEHINQIGLKAEAITKDVYL